MSKSSVLCGVRVLEVAFWVFVTSAGATLADWGAEVIKVEDPITGDPVRGLVTSGRLPGDAGGVNYMFEQTNRGKRSVGINLKTEEGRELLYRLAETSDVFLTNFRKDALQRFEIDLEHIRARNPQIIYARGTGQGARGPDAQKGGMDSTAYWARSGIAMAVTPLEREYPVERPPAFGDVTGGQTIAGGIAAALFHRERTGEAVEVDVSLLSTGMWSMGPIITAAKLYEEKETIQVDRLDNPNPLAHIYKTNDDRFISLSILESDRFWADFCKHIDHPELIDDGRFKDMTSRFANRAECIRLLDGLFAERTLAEWKDRFETLAGVWAAVQHAGELHEDCQVVANGYIREILVGGTTPVSVVANPVQFNATPPDLRAAPEHGQHTEEVLLELGCTWEELATLKDRGAIS